MSAKLNPGEAVIQFLMQKTVITAMHMDGNSRASIYRELTEKRKISMSYEAFIYNMRKYVFKKD